MAVLFSSDAEQVIHRDVEADDSNEDGDQWQEFFEVERCCQWIRDGQFKRVALQFPDKYLCSAALLSRIIQDKTKVEVFILADTSYGSCCVDEVSALHYNADAIIHYGHSCLSPSDRLPTLCVFGKSVIDTSDIYERVKQEIPCSTKVLVTFSVEYSHVKEIVHELLSQHFTKVFIPKFIQPINSQLQTASLELSTESTFKLYNRHFVLPSGDSMEDYTILYIGQESMFLTNMMLALTSCTFYTYNPKLKICQKQGQGINKLLMKRFYLVERIKDAQIVGILVATLSVSHYLEIVNRMKLMLNHAGKKYYVFSVGKINVAKLSNFPDVDVFVLVSCPESVILDSSEYFRPIVTPYEVELACNPEREWKGNIIMDYTSFLPGGACYKELDLDTPLDKMDVSLISGRVRKLGLAENESNASGSSTVAIRDSMTLSAVTGDRFSSKTWQGLDPQLGQTEVTKAIEGRKGIAIQYEEEPS